MSDPCGVHPRFAGHPVTSEEREAVRREEAVQRKRRRFLLARRRRGEVLDALDHRVVVTVDGREVYQPWPGEPFVAYRVGRVLVDFQGVTAEAVAWGRADG